MNYFKKVKNIIETILLILLVFYFAKALWINFMSYDNVKKIPRLNVGAVKY